LLPTLATKPPVAASQNIHLLGFSDSHPSRQIAMLWRKSSAMTAFLSELSKVFSELPAELFAPNAPGAASVGHKPKAKPAAVDLVY
ncbi:MAG TPA: DNA-binding transcriptional regulator OxyR, partial [Pseudoxanthomonas sp.]|nr:DNA-binding transcriptional regulator OxyR [Pseudoxanthomonas sp.]